MRLRRGLTIYNLVHCKRIIGGLYSYLGACFCILCPKNLERWWGHINDILSVCESVMRVCQCILGSEYTRRWCPSEPTSETCDYLNSFELC